MSRVHFKSRTVSASGYGHLAHGLYLLLALLIVLGLSHPISLHSHRTIALYPVPRAAFCCPSIKFFFTSSLLGGKF